MREWFADFQQDLWLRGKSHVDSAEEAKFIYKALHLRKGQRVLDAPCGEARIAVHLARAGVDVTGVDITKTFLARARGLFHKEKLKGAFYHKDLRDIDFNGEFDAVFNWFGSFGYFPDRENVDVVTRFAKALKPGGRLLIDQVNRERVLRNFKSKQSGERLTVKAHWNSKSQRVESEWTLTQKDGRRISSRSSIRMYTIRQFRALFEKAGLALEKVYGTIVGEPYSRKSARMIVVGRKLRNR
jgi:SAM-dependent methyltransferase